MEWIDTCLLCSFGAKTLRKMRKRVVGVKSYSPEISVNNESVLHGITDEGCDEIQEKCLRFLVTCINLNLVSENLCSCLVHIAFIHYDSS